MSRDRPVGSEADHVFEAWSARRRDPERITRIAEKLGSAWALAPDLRLGQLVVALAGKQDPFYTEDDVIELALDRALGTGEISGGD